MALAEAPVRTQTLRALLYDRVSTANQAKSGYSSGQAGFQIDLCRAHAERKGYAVVGSRTDVDSGAKWDVDGLLGAIEMAKRGEFDVLIVADSGRFARNLAKKLVYEGELRRHGIRVEYTNLPVEDTAEGRLVANMFGSYDEYEREKITWRLKNGRLSKARRGQYVANFAPYGYRLVRTLDASQQRMVITGIEPDPETAPIAQRIYREALRLSAADIAAGLTAEGIAAPRGDHWTQIGVYGLLCNPAFKGTVTYGRSRKGYRSAMGTGIAIAVPALVTVAEWDAVQAAMMNRKIARRGRGPTSSDPYELRGLLHCAECGGPLATHSKNARRYYFCLRHDTYKVRQYGWAPCSLPAVHAEGATGLEAFAWACVTDVLLDEERLRRGLEQQQAANADAWATRRIRLEILDEEIAKHERLLRRAVEEKLRIDQDDARYAIYDQAESQEARTVRRLTEERGAFELSPSPGLSDEQGEMLQRFAAEVRVGVAAATSEERRRIFQLLRLQGTVKQDRERGVMFGSHTYFTVQWESLLPIGNSTSSVLIVRALLHRGGLGLVSVERVETAA